MKIPTKLLSKKRRWIMALVFALAALLLFYLSQKPTIVSSSITPEVIVKGQDTEVAVKVEVKPKLFVPPWYKLYAVLLSQDPEQNYNYFNNVIQTLGGLTKTEVNKNGTVVYSGKFTISHEKAETLQVQILDIHN